MGLFCVWLRSYALLVTAYGAVESIGGNPEKTLILLDLVGLFSHFEVRIPSPLRRWFRFVIYGRLCFAPDASFQLRKGKVLGNPAFSGFVFAFLIDALLLAPETTIGAPFLGRAITPL